MSLNTLILSRYGHFAFTLSIPTLMWDSDYVFANFCCDTVTDTVSGYLPVDGWGRAMLYAGKFEQALQAWPLQCACSRAQRVVAKGMPA